MEDLVNKEEDGHLKLKITLIRNSVVGKTSIITRYISNVYIDNKKATKGANYLNLLVKEIIS